MTEFGSLTNDPLDYLTRSIIEDDTAQLMDLFRTNGAPAPRLIWSPHPADLQNPILQRFSAVCRSLEGADGRIDARQVLPDDFAALKDWLILLEPDADGSLRYAYYGGGVAEHYGADMTGQTTEGFGGHISLFFSALYRAVAQRGEWVLSEHEPPQSVFVRRWRRLIVPLYDGETPTHFAVANIPENELRTGLELMVDPVFVCAPDQTVHYANKAARRLFAAAKSLRSSALLRDITGIELTGLPHPDEMVARQTSEDSIELIHKGAIIERLVMTVSAAEHRGKSFYIVVMRLIGT